MSNHPPRWLPDRARAVYEDTAARIAHYTPELDGPALLAYSAVSYTHLIWPPMLDPQRAAAAAWGNL